MALPGIQQDFGGFDPKFLGVTIKIASGENWQSVKSQMEGRDPETEFILAHPPRKAFELLSLATVLSHEFRHFHDFLVSPFGAEIFRSRIMALVNAQQF